VSWNLRAEELPEVRADLARYLDSPLAQRIWEAVESVDPVVRFEWPPGTDPPPDRRRALALLRQGERDRLLRAELYSVTEDMTEVILHASRSLPCYRLHPEDVPSPAGFCVWRSPIGLTGRGGAPIHAVSWGEVPGGVWLGWYAVARPETLTRLEAAGMSPAEVDRFLSLGPHVRGAGEPAALRRGAAARRREPGDGRGRDVTLQRPLDDLARHG
jgi:hypothetical protein